MCKIFINAEAGLYTQRVRSLRLHGAVTSLRLEQLFWQVLAEIAERDGMTLNQLLTRLHDEILQAHGEVKNFASFLRVSCMRYLSLQLAGGIPKDRSVPIRSLDADAVLALEQRQHGPQRSERGLTAARPAAPGAAAPWRSSRGSSAETPPSTAPRAGA